MKLMVHVCVHEVTASWQDRNVLLMLSLKPGGGRITLYDFFAPVTLTGRPSYIPKDVPAECRPK